jgi:hypothetical protein
MFSESDCRQGRALKLSFSRAPGPSPTPSRPWVNRPPPMDLRYEFDIKEDCNGKEAL